jgi:pseudouridine-5'-phosphate glycosidase
MTAPMLELLPEVKEALKKGLPVVALESTIISHGMPYPQNVATALAVEEEVRRHGAVPATIALIDGKCRVGLLPGEIDHFGKAHGVWKVSLRDLPFVLAKKLAGATTVAATMRIASLAGIRIFVTGGIGGVHRGAEQSMDISADLTEMSKTSVAVVSAGVKSILDIGLTLEYLETMGVPVVTFGQKEFPSFYSGKSGYGSPLQMNDPEEIGLLLHIKWSMGLEGSVLVANPVPASIEIGREEMERHIQKALAAADHHQVKGKEVTPFLLKFLADHTAGESLETNIALIKNNAMLGAKLAVAYESLA